MFSFSFFQSCFILFILSYPVSSFLVSSEIMSYPISAWCVLVSQISLQGGHCQSDCGFYIDVSRRMSICREIMWDSVQEFSALELNTRFLEKRAHDKTHILDRIPQFVKIHTGWERHDLDHSQRRHPEVLWDNASTVVNSCCAHCSTVSRNI